MNDILKSTYKSPPGLVIFLNGTSSSGKTTIAKALQSKLEEPFMIVSLDTYLNQLSKEVLDKSGRFDKPIVTKILKAVDFFSAESYHQNYYKVCPLKYGAYKIGSGRGSFIKEHWKK